MSILLTRTFGLQFQGGEKITSLIPFADMFNHRHPQETVWYYDTQLEGYVVKALVDFK